MSIFYPESGSVYSCALIPGTLLTQSHQIINPLGKTITPPIDLISLNASGESFCLSEALRDIESLTLKVEKKMLEQFKELPQSAADLSTCVEFNCK